MGERIDEAKGKAEEAMGNLADDKDLERQGKVDRASGKVKETLTNAKEHIEDAIDRTKEKVSESLKGDE